MYRPSLSTICARARTPSVTANDRTNADWIQYRGPGTVTFAPDASSVVYGEPVTLTAKATFSAPGTYVLRATAYDGQRYTTRDVTVIVNPMSSVQNPR